MPPQSVQTISNNIEIRRKSTFEPAALNSTRLVVGQDKLVIQLSQFQDSQSRRLNSPGDC